MESNENVVPQLTAGGFRSAEQGKRAHTPPPCPAPHPRLNPIRQKEALLSGIRARSNPNFQAHPPLESNSGFRLISRWNQTRLSGSFLDWKMLPFATCCPTGLTDDCTASVSWAPVSAVLPAANGCGPVTPPRARLLRLVPGIFAGSSRAHALLPCPEVFCIDISYTRLCGTSGRKPRARYVCIPSSLLFS